MAADAATPAGTATGRSPTDDDARRSDQGSKRGRGAERRSAGAGELGWEDRRRARRRFAEHHLADDRLIGR